MQLRAGRCHLKAMEADEMMDRGAGPSAPEHLAPLKPEKLCTRARVGDNICQPERLELGQEGQRQAAPPWNTLLAALFHRDSVQEQ